MVPRATPFLLLSLLYSFPPVKAFIPSGSGTALSRVGKGYRQDRSSTSWDERKSGHSSSTTTTTNSRRRGRTETRMQSSRGGSSSNAGGESGLMTEQRPNPAADPTATGGGGGAAAAPEVGSGSASEALRERQLLPSAPLPPIILSNKPGTWAYDTMSRRVRENILMRVYDEVDWDELPEEEAAAAREGLDALVKDLTTPKKSKIRPIGEDGGPEVHEWNTLMHPFMGKNWLDTPWLYSEFYVYRRLMEGMGYFKTGLDPFAKQKLLGVTSALESMEALSKRLLHSHSLSVEAGLKLYLSTALWGNRMDLSLWPVSTTPEEDGDIANGDNDSVDVNNNARSSDVFANVLQGGDDELLCDDSGKVVQALMTRRAAAEARAVAAAASCGILATAIAGAGPGPSRVDIVVDNAGFELFCDLCLADYLVESRTVDSVVLQLKGHPTFVSDATKKDLNKMVDLLAGLDTAEFPSAAAIGKRWRQRITEGQWVLKADYFWAQPSPFWELPSHIYTQLQQESFMTIVKGDANYRRTLGDRLWDYTLPFDEVAGYFPTRLVALRTLKAELGCGMDKDRVHAAAASDDTWMTDGKWGVIQYVDPFTERTASDGASAET